MLLTQLLGLAEFNASGGHGDYLDAHENYTIHAVVRLIFIKFEIFQSLVMIGQSRKCIERAIQTIDTKVEGNVS